MESGRYGAKVQTSYQLGKKKAFLYGIFTGGVGALSYCAMLTVLWYGGRLVIAGASSVCPCVDDRVDVQHGVAQLIGVIQPTPNTQGK